MRLYLDTAPVIYTVEQVPGYAIAVDARLSAPELVLVASDLTRLECRVKPVRDGNADLLNKVSPTEAGVNRRASPPVPQHILCRTLRG